MCIFAYGQTGSGKTFTMEGADGEENQGMIPRAVEQIFITANELQTKGWKVPKINIVQFEQKIYDLRFWS